MEPLTGFFLLEGLIFEIIGVILLAKGISDIDLEFSYFSNKTDHVSIKEINDCIEITVDSVDDLKTNLSDAVTKFEVRRNTKLLQNFKNKSRQALPFLVGGFLLQIIAVGIQLG